MSIFITVTLSLLEGLLTTFKIFALTLLMALPLGLIISFGSMSKIKVIKWPIKTLIWIIRGTPLMLQLIVFGFGPGLLGIDGMDTFVAVMIAFVLNYACYFSEIFRGGIEGIPKGQYEAGAVLGLTKSQIFFKIILMQVVKRIIPPMGNEIITLVKDTSLARVIAVSEIIMKANEYSAEGLIWPLFYTGAFFLIFNGLLTILLSKVERRLDYYRG